MGTIKAHYGDPINVEPEDIPIILDLIDKRITKIEKKKKHDIVDLIVMHSLSNLRKKLAS